MKHITKLKLAAKQYSEQNHFTSLTQCFKEVVNSNYVQKQILQAKIDMIELISNKYYIQLYDDLAELNDLRSRLNEKLKQLT